MMYSFRTRRTDEPDRSVQPQSSSVYRVGMPTIPYRSPTDADPYSWTMVSSSRSTLSAPAPASGGHQLEPSRTIDLRSRRVLGVGPRLICSVVRRVRGGPLRRSGCAVPVEESLNARSDHVRDGLLDSGESDLPENILSDGLDVRGDHGLTGLRPEALPLSSSGLRRDHLRFWSYLLVRLTVSRKLRADRRSCHACSCSLENL